MLSISRSHQTNPINQNKQSTILEQKDQRISEWLAFFIIDWQRNIHEKGASCILRVCVSVEFRIVIVFFLVFFGYLWREICFKASVYHIIGQRFIWAPIWVWFIWISVLWNDNVSRLYVDLVWNGLRWTNRAYTMRFALFFFINLCSSNDL